MRKRPLFIAALAVLGLWAVSPFKLGIVLGSSMTPTLKNHQVILIQRGYFRSHAPRVGDVAVFDRDSDTLVKRVWAVQGETVWEVRDPSVGSFLVATESELRSLRRTVRNAPGVGTLHRVTVPPGCVYVVGDAGQCSLDSRSFGPISVRSLTGRVVGVPALSPNWR